MDYLVIGGGPAGLQLAYFLAQAGRDYLVLEAGPTAGTFFRTFPLFIIFTGSKKSSAKDPQLYTKIQAYVAR